MKSWKKSVQQVPDTKCSIHISFLWTKTIGISYNFHILTVYKKKKTCPINYINMNSSTISLIKSGKASAWILPMMANSLLHKAAHFVFRKPNSLLSRQHLPSWDFYPLILMLHSRITQRKVQFPFQGQFFKYMSPRLLALVPCAPDQVSRFPRRQTWVWILILSLTSCVALSKLFYLSEPVSSYVY